MTRMSSNCSQLLGRNLALGQVALAGKQPTSSPHRFCKFNFHGALHVRAPRNLDGIAADALPVTVYLMGLPWLHMNFEKRTFLHSSSPRV